MKLGLVIYSNDPETVWNAVRLGLFSLKKSDEVKVFLLAKWVQCESLDTEKFSVTKEMKLFVESGGEILACGTCLKIRQSEGSDMCPMSTMKDLYQIISESDKVITFQRCHADDPGIGRYLCSDLFGTYEQKQSIILIKITR